MLSLMKQVNDIHLERGIVPQYKPYNGLLYKVFRFKDKNILFDGRSFAIIETTEEGIKKLNLFKNFISKKRKSAFGKVMQEIETLIHSKVLSVEDDEYFEAPTFKKLIILLTSNCNLRCRYCFEETYRCEENDHLMIFAVAQKSLEYLFEHSPSNEVFVHFYGGEPLKNFKVIKFIASYGKQLEVKYGKKIKYFLITNGTLFTKTILNFLRKNDISVQVSLDGCEEVHDANRVYPNGKGSYKNVIKGLKLLKSNKINYSVLAVVSKQAASSSAWIANLNDIADGKFAMTIASNRDEAIKPTPTQIRLFVLKYKKVLSDLTGMYSNCVHNILPVKKIEDQIKNGGRHFYGCGGGLEELTVAPDGNMYLCERLRGKLDCNIRNALPPCELWYGYTNDITNSKCRLCWAKYLCGGGCAHSIDTFSKNRLPPSWMCEIKKSEIETAVRLIYNLSIRNGAEKYGYSKN